MRYSLKVSYAGQTVQFTGLELDDEVVRDESYPAGIEANNYQITENFLENMEVEVIRLPKPAQTKKVQWRQIAGGYKVGLEGKPPESCDLCSGPFLNFAYDAKTVHGPWGWLCQTCFNEKGIGLGLGLGQRYERAK
jgi:hypothetical protein